MASGGGQEKALVIKAKGGLGNRMLSGVTGLVLARLLGRTAYIDWRDGMYLDKGENLYPLLFDAGWMGDVCAFDDAGEVAPAVWSGRMREHPTDLIHSEFPDAHQDPLVYRKLSVDLVANDPREPVAVFWSYIAKLKRLRRRMNASAEFGGKSEDAVTRALLSEYFAPVPDVMRTVDDALPETSQPTIGVHIRFTDRKVPLAKILKGLERLDSQTRRARIFLATDSAEARQAVLSRYPDAVEIEKTLPDDGAALHVASSQYSDPLTEARSALADMIALSRCDYLVHSSHSTFSVAAALIGNIAPRNQIDVGRTNLKIVLKKFIQARI